MVAHSVEKTAGSLVSRMADLTEKHWVGCWAGLLVARWAVETVVCSGGWMVEYSADKKDALTAVPMAVR